MSANQGNGRVFQINTSSGGVPKHSVPAAEVTEQGISGDRQTDLRVHGGPDRALCIYSLERLQQLQVEGHPTYSGAFGENLTISGIDWEQVEPGQQFRIGADVLIEVTRYTNPCNNLVPFFQDGNYGRISQTQHPGWSRVYARVLAPGRIRPGDEFTQILG